MFINIVIQIKFIIKKKILEGKKIIIFKWIRSIRLKMYFIYESENYLNDCQSEFFY